MNTQQNHTNKKKQMIPSKIWIYIVFKYCELKEIVQVANTSKAMMVQIYKIGIKKKKWILSDLEMLVKSQNTLLPIILMKNLLVDIGNYHVFLEFVFENNKKHATKIIIFLLETKFKKLESPHIHYHYLNYACKKGFYNVAIHLLQKGYIDPNFKLNEPFKSACKSGHFNIVKYLVFTVDKSKLNLSIDNHYPLRKTVKKGHIEIFEFLLKIIGSQQVLTPKIIGELFQSACDHGQIQIAQLLFSNPLLQLVSLDKPLQSACKNGHYTIVKFLLKDNRINLKDGRFVKYACSEGHTDIVQLLLTDKRTKITPEDKNQIIKLASEKQFVSIINLVWKHS